MGDSKLRIFRYKLPGNWILLAGASDTDNDTLSTKLAKLDDWWFHVKGVSGSHVLLRAKPDEEPNRDTLHKAAAVAAYYSKARKAGTVGVHCTRAHYVKKRRGAKIGTVEVSQGKVLKVRPDISFATRLPSKADSDE